MSWAVLDSSCAAKCRLEFRVIANRYSITLFVIPRWLLRIVEQKTAMGNVENHLESPRSTDGMHGSLTRIPRDQIPCF